MDQSALFHAQHNQQENLTQDWVQRHRSRTAGEYNDEPHRGLASRLYLSCLALLRRIFLQQKSSKKESNALEEELGKFYLWGHGLADGTLDQALEYSEDIKIEVLDSLRSVGRSLLRAYPSNPITESTLPEDTRQEVSVLIDQAQAVTSSKGLGSSHGDVEENSESDTEDEDEPESSYDGLLVRKLAQQTGWLSQLSTSIEQNYVRAKVQQKRALYPPVVPFSVSGPAQFYVGLVQDKFKNAERKLVERFGEANWQRHVNIRNQLDSETSAAEEATAHSVFRPHSAFHDSGIGTSVPAHTTYAASHTSFRSSASETARSSICVPPTPVEVDAGKPFQCFLCKMMLSNIKNRIDWKMHVFSDLQPYICTFPDCPNELAQFPSRAAWAEHEFSQHRTKPSWKCPECHEKYESDSKWEHHLYMQHDIKLIGNDLQIAKRLAFVVEEAARIDGEECPLCHKVLYEARRGYVKHVGTHMEEIALITLPRNTEEDEDSTSGSTSVSSDRGSMRLVSDDLQTFATNFILTSSGPVGDFQKMGAGENLLELAAGKIENPDNSAEGVTTLDDPSARSTLPSEASREQKLVQSNETGLASVSENDWIKWDSEDHDDIGSPGSNALPDDPFRATFPPISSREKWYRVENDDDIGLKTRHGLFGPGTPRPDTVSQSELAATEQVFPVGHPCLASPDCHYRTDKDEDLERHYRAKHPGQNFQPQKFYFACTNVQK